MYNNPNLITYFQVHQDINNNFQDILIQLIIIKLDFV